MGDEKKERECKGEEEVGRNSYCRDGYKYNQGPEAEAKAEVTVLATVGVDLASEEYHFRCTICCMSLLSFCCICPLIYNPCTFNRLCQYTSCFVTSLDSFSLFYLETTTQSSSRKLRMNLEL